MVTFHYEKEPLDLKLLLLRLARQSGLILLVTLIGTVLFGGGYYLKNVALAPRQYAAMSLYQVEYQMDPISHLEYTYINGETWKRWMVTEEFLDILYEKLAGTEDAAIDRSVMKTYLSAELLTDLRMPDTIVMTSDPELTLRLASAVELSMVEFAGYQKGIDNIRVVDPAVDTWLHNTSRPLNACILAALLSLLAVTAVVLWKELASDSLWLPVQIMRRYGVKAAAPTGTPGLAADLEYLLQDKKVIGVICNQEDQDSAVWAEQLQKLMKPGQEHCWIALPHPALCPEVLQKLPGLEGMVLIVPAGAGAGSRLEALLTQLAVHDRTPDAVLLTDIDELLLKCYYGKETVRALIQRKQPGGQG